VEKNDIATVDVSLAHGDTRSVIDKNHCCMSTPVSWAQRTAQQTITWYGPYLRPTLPYLTLPAAATTGPFTRRHVRLVDNDEKRAPLQRSSERFISN